MIYTNFLIFIGAIILYSVAPLGSASVGDSLSVMFNLYGIFLVSLGFWQFNRYKFMKLRASLQEEQISLGYAKKKYLQMTNFHMIIAIFVFAIEVYFFKLKTFLFAVPVFGEFESFVNLVGIGVFIVHLSMIWYWAFRGMGDTISLGKSAGDHIKANIKFNLVIVFTWLSLLFVLELINIFSTPTMRLFINSPLGQVLIVGFFIILLAIFSPIFIKWLWECKPLEDSEMKETIESFSRSQGVKFKQILSWNALNGGLVTAGVLGLISPFRYLLITPELMSLLNREELLGVISHEIGHVKKRHLLYYLIFFLAFLFISIGVFQLGYALFSDSLAGWFVVVQGNDNSGSETLSSILSIILYLSLFVLYFRFIFGYFMRNFEREADVYCFHAGVNPNNLVSSFDKLERHLGSDDKKSNWHHFTIPQRVNFLESCMEDPDKIVKHEKKVKRSLKFFLTFMLIFLIPFSYMMITLPSSPLEALERQIEKNPNNSTLYAVLGQIYYNLENWEKAKNALNKSLKLNHHQPGVLNNLAWLLLKCPEKKHLNPKRALRLARDAVKLNHQSYHFMDTLAEAYFQNAMYKEAFLAAKQAYQMARDNLDYYRKQLEKMAKFYKRFKNVISI